jgi:hypothetical protein
MGELYAHYTFVPWDDKRWPKFSPGERNLACPCCGEFYLDDIMFDRLQFARTESGRSFHINSGHRCVRHNRTVGGRERSRHLRLAFDISLAGHNHLELLGQLRGAGFTTFGFYNSFIHTDDRPGRIWYTKSGREKWKP